MPIDDNTTALLAAYLAERHLDGPGSESHPVFFDQHRANSAAAVSPGSFASTGPGAHPALATAQVSPTSCGRRAMHLYDSGVPLPTSATSSATST